MSQEHEHQAAQQPNYVALCLMVGMMLGAGMGVLFSLRSSTVQLAQQTTMSVLLLPLMVAQFGLLVILKSESARETLKATVGALSFRQLVSIIVGVLGALAALLLLAGMGRFKRSRLMLSQ